MIRTPEGLPPGPRPPVVLLIAETAFGSRSIARSVEGRLREQGSVRPLLLDLGALLGRTAVYRLATGEGTLAEDEIEALNAAASIDVSSDERCVLAAFDAPAAAVVGAWGAALGERCLTAAAITTLAPAPEWFGAAMDLYLVVDLEAAESVLPPSIPPERIVPVGGISLCGSFAAGACELPAPVRGKLGLDVHAFTLLLVTAALSPDRGVAALRALSGLGDAAGRPVQVLVDMAEDLEMRRALSRELDRLDLPVTLFGKVDRAPDWWACADAVALKPVDYLVSRALGYGRPLLVLEPDGPTARRLASELGRRNVAEVVPSLDRLADAVHGMLVAERWEALSASARTHARSGGVDRMAGALMQLLRSGPGTD